MALPHTVSMNEWVPLLVQFGVPGLVVVVAWRLIDRGFEFRVPPRRRE